MCHAAQMLKLGQLPFLLLLCALAWTGLLSAADPPKNALDGAYPMSGVEFSVAVDNKGCRINLLLLPSGEILAMFYNHPSHGFGCGNVELWANADGTIVTAYYWGGRAEEGKYGGRTDLPDGRGLPWHPRYHMGIMRWRTDGVALPK